MGVLRLIGLVLIAYGPSAVLLFQFVIPRSILFILAAASAFMWLLAALISSIFWIAIPPAKDIHALHAVFGPVFQESARALLVMGYMKVEKRLPSLLPKGSLPQLSDASSAIACGVGFGLMHGLIMYGPVIVQSDTKASFYLDGCSSLSIFEIAAASALMYAVLHISLMIWAFDTYRKHRIRSVVRGSYVFVAHIAFTLVSLAYDGSGCTAALGIQAALVIVIALSAWFGVVARHDYSSRETADETGLGAHFAEVQRTVLSPSNVAR